VTLPNCVAPATYVDAVFLGSRAGVAMTAPCRRIAIHEPQSEHGQRQGRAWPAQANSMSLIAEPRVIRQSLGQSDDGDANRGRSAAALATPREQRPRPYNGFQGYVLGRRPRGRRRLRRHAHGEGGEAQHKRGAVLSARFAERQAQPPGSSAPAWRRDAILSRCGVEGRAWRGNGGLIRGFRGPGHLAFAPCTADRPLRHRGARVPAAGSRCSFRFCTARTGAGSQREACRSHNPRPTDATFPLVSQEGVSPVKAFPVAEMSPKTGSFARALAASGAGPVHDSSYYAKCMMGGILSCGLTHTAMVPLDIVKCRMQTNPEVYKGLIQGFGEMTKSGNAAMTVGWLPTLIGYSAQGLCKFGFYEMGKDFYSSLVGPEIARDYKSLVFAAASASAEFVADMALCPMEAVKVRMQTSLPEANFPTEFGPALARIRAEEGTAGLFKGLAPLWGRQIPYTVVKFVAFERVVEAFYKNIFTEPKASYSKGTQLGVTFASGYVAGVFCAIISHPADTIVSKLNNSDTATIGGIVNDMGIVALATKGLAARILMIGTLTGLQWWIYDTFKSAVGLQTSGGK